MTGAKNRREFLTAGLAGKEDVSQADEVNDSEQSLNLSRHQRAYLESYKKNAMACEFEVLFNLHQYKHASAAALAAFESIDSLEEQMTVYRSTSEVTYINEHAGKEVVSVEPGLFGLLQLACEIHDATDGAFDVTSWPLSELWGFSRRDGKVPNVGDIESTLELVDAKQIELQGENEIKFNRAELRINLGGIGKGFALDRVAEQMQKRGIADFIIHGGQSSVVARGNSIDGTAKTAWTVGLSHPIHAGKRLAEISLGDAALGTSGTGRQGFYHQGKRYGHIIDPRTGWPTNHFLSTTVVCESAARADALATAFFVMKLNEVEDFCRRDESVKAMIVASDKAGKNSIEVFNMDGDEYKILG